MDNYIGIDLGTSSVKAVLATEAGEVIDKVSYAYEVTSNSTGLSEINPDIWFEGVMYCLHRLTKEEKNIRAIGVTGQMHSLTLLGDDGAAIRPVMMWNDLRTNTQAQKLKEIAEKNGLDHISGIVSTGSPAANLLFIRENEADVFRKINKILIGHDYVVYRLTGHAGADYCEASTSSLYDIENRCWAQAVLDYIGIDCLAMPELLPSGCIAGTLNKGLCEQLGLVGVPAVTEGTGDNAANIVTLGTPCISLGTSGVFIERRHELRKDKKGKNILFSINGEEPSVFVQGVVQSVGSAMEWIRCILGVGSVREMLQKLPAKVDEGLMFYPHINGDKTLYRDSSLRGAFFGLSLSTSREEIATAAMEGICFALRQMIEQVSANEADLITVTGGLTESCMFLQTLSNVLERDLKTVEDNHGAAYGAVLLAMNMEGVVSKFQSGTGRVYSADGCMLSYYRNKYERYLQIHNSLPW